MTGPDTRLRVRRALLMLTLLLGSILLWSAIFDAPTGGGR